MDVIIRLPLVPLILSFMFIISQSLTSIVIVSDASVPFPNCSPAYTSNEQPEVLEEYVTISVSYLLASTLLMTTPVAAS